MIEPVVLVHGGAWGVPDKWVNQTVEGVKLAASIGYKVLTNGGTAIDAVEAAVQYLEDNEYFNSGRGSSLNIAGEAVMEASMQRGSDLEAGCVTLIKDIHHPISLARKVLEESPHAFIGGEGAKKFAVEMGLDILPPSYFVTDGAKEELQEYLDSVNIQNNPKDTVGCVVVDCNGHVAAGTSTGGTVGKYIGRIGDAPQIGNGTYADDFVGAVSSTGHGESILKFSLAHSIIKQMELGSSAQESAKKCLDSMTARLNNTAGAIAVSNKGDVGHYFTTKRMSWCYIKAGEMNYGIEPGQHDKQPFNNDPSI